MKPIPASVKEGLREVLVATKSPNPDAVDGTAEPFRMSGSAPETLPPLPTKPKECRCDELSGVSGQLPNCLHEADRLTSQDRNNDYGHPLGDYTCTAALWTAILRHAGVLKDGAEITAELAIQCMVQVKLSREAFRHKDDNLIDAAGYLRCLEMARERREVEAADQGFGFFKG